MHFFDFVVRERILLKRLWIILAGLIILAEAGNRMPVLAGYDVWTQSSRGIWMNNVRILALSPGYVNDYTLFAGTDAGVFKSTDSGASWSAMNTGLSHLDVHALALSPGYPADRTLFCGTHSGGVFKSINGGAS